MDTQATIKQEAEALLTKMIGKFEVEVTDEGDNVYHVVVKTEEEAPTVIGRHGETIRALQKILEVVLYKQLGQSISVLLNVNDYRERQRVRLEGIAAQLAEKVIETQRPAPFRGLSSYERKMIHEYVTHQYPDLTTYSVGEGRDRQLMIDVKREE